MKTSTKFAKTVLRSIRKRKTLTGLVELINQTGVEKSGGVAGRGVLINRDVSLESTNQRKKRASQMILRTGLNNAKRRCATCDVSAVNRLGTV